MDLKECEKCKEIIGEDESYYATINRFGHHFCLGNTSQENCIFCREKMNFDWDYFIIQRNESKGFCHNNCLVPIDMSKYKIYPRYDKR